MPTDQNPQVTVKTEMGTYKRLPSFRSPRDLKLSQFRDLASAATLGEAKPKKVYVPNLNVHRKRLEDREESRPKDVSPTSTAPRDTRDRGRGPEERGRSRGRGGRKSREFIQQSGVFSQGLAPSMKPAWGNKNYESTPSLSVPKPKLKQNENTAVNKEEEDAMLKELLRDDFIDDGSIEPDAENAPVELPLQDYCKLGHLKDDTFDCSFGYSAVKAENRVKGLSVKPDPESKVAPDINGTVESKSVDVQKIKPVGLSQLLSTSQEKNFLFFQLPNRIPHAKVKAKASSSLPPNKRSGERQQEEEGKNKKASALRDLPPGRFGTLQIRKSGRAVLVLGDVRLDVQPGTQCAFKQDLVSVNLDNSTKNGNMINVGKITTRILVTPDWKNLLKPQ